jgi:hypothetical protein
VPNVGTLEGTALLVAIGITCCSIALIAALQTGQVVATAGQAVDTAGQ